MARPPLHITPMLRQRVSIAAASGMSHEEIAAALGLSSPTLRKHFRAELSAAAAVHRFEVLNALFRAALNGNVSAAKAFVACAWGKK